MAERLGQPHLHLIMLRGPSRRCFSMTALKQLSIYLWRFGHWMALAS